MKRKIVSYFYVLSLSLFVLSCSTPQQKEQKGTVASKVTCQDCKTEQTKVQHLDWSRNAVIYEVNLRQYTKEGTIKAFRQHLPRLKELGVDILWFMPIFPISEKNRKGSLGSYYSVADYEKINPEFGTLADFKAMVDEAHKLGMYVILDWVANHTGWDNWWITKHPEWYTHNEKGEIISPVDDWTDTADLNYDNKDMRKRMEQSFKFWINEANVDGFRCDMAGMVPVDFWNNLRQELDSIKPVFMLAEAWEPELVTDAFDMAYGWEFHHLMNDLAQGKKTVKDLEAHIAKMDTLYSCDSYMLNFITNHDENSWNGTVEERMGEAAKAFAVLYYVVPGMPLIYSGQEVGLNKPLEFFEKDEIKWDDPQNLQGFYKKLNQLKHESKVLAAGCAGGSLRQLKTNNPEQVFAFYRQKDGEILVAIFNFSASEKEVLLTGLSKEGSYENYFTGEKEEVKNSENKMIEPWGYRIYIAR